MSTMPTTSRAAIAVAIAGLTASLLTGCFGNPADMVNQGVEDAIESATGGEVSLDGELPADFPDIGSAHRGRHHRRRGRGRDRGMGRRRHPVGSATTRWPMRHPPSRPRASPRTSRSPATAAGAAVYSDGEYPVLLVGEGIGGPYTVAPTQ